MGGIRACLPRSLLPLRESRRHRPRRYSPPSTMEGRRSPSGDLRPALDRRATRRVHPPRLPPFRDVTPRLHPRRDGRVHRDPVLGRTSVCPSPRAGRAVPLALRHQRRARPQAAPPVRPLLALELGIGQWYHAPECASGSHAVRWRTPAHPPARPPREPSVRKSEGVQARHQGRLLPDVPQGPRLPPPGHRPPAVRRRASAHRHPHGLHHGLG